MNNNDVVKKAIEAAAAKAGIGDVKDFLKKKGADVEKVEVKAEPKREKYCNGDCQKSSIIKQSAVVLEPEKVRTTPIWPIDPETPEQFYARLALERKEAATKREAFLKSLDTPEHLAEIRATAIAAVKAMPTRHVSSTVADKKREVKEEKREAKAKVKEEKKDSSRQTRLGQTKLIDDLLKAGKNEKEIFDTVREKIPTYPADKLPKLIKLRQYHTKK